MTYSAIHLVAYSQLGYKYIEFWNYKDKKIRIQIFTYSCNYHIQ